MNQNLLNLALLVKNAEAPAAAAAESAIQKLVAAGRTAAGKPVAAASHGWHSVVNPLLATGAGAAGGAGIQALRGEDPVEGALWGGGLAGGGYLGAKGIGHLLAGSKGLSEEAAHVMNAARSGTPIKPEDVSWGAKLHRAGEYLRDMDPIRSVGRSSVRGSRTFAGPEGQPMSVGTLEEAQLARKQRSAAKPRNAPEYADMAAAAAKVPPPAPEPVAPQGILAKLRAAQRKYFGNFLGGDIKISAVCAKYDDQLIKQAKAFLVAERLVKVTNQ